MKKIAQQGFMTTHRAHETALPQPEADQIQNPMDFQSGDMVQGQVQENLDSYNDMDSNDLLHSRRCPVQVIQRLSIVADWKGS
jgi:hypothetical protein